MKNKQFRAECWSPLVCSGNFKPNIASSQNALSGWCALCDYLNSGRLSRTGVSTLTDATSRAFHSFKLWEQQKGKRSSVDWMRRHSGPHAQSHARTRAITIPWRPSSAYSVKKSLDQGNRSFSFSRLPGISDYLFKPAWLCWV